MSDNESRAADADADRLDDAMEHEHRLLGHDDPTDYEHCYLCVQILALADEHARGGTRRGSRGLSRLRGLRRRRDDRYLHPMRGDPMKLLRGWTLSLPRVGELSRRQRISGLVSMAAMAGFSWWLAQPVAATPLPTGGSGHVYRVIWHGIVHYKSTG